MERGKVRKRGTRGRKGGGCQDKSGRRNEREQKNKRGRRKVKQERKNEKTKWMLQKLRPETKEDKQEKEETKNNAVTEEERKKIGKMEQKKNVEDMDCLAFVPCNITCWKMEILCQDPARREKKR